MADSWASYKNEESEIVEFIVWLGGTNDDWKERNDTKWVIQIEQIQFLYFPMGKKLVVYGGKKQLRIAVNKFMTFIQENRKTAGRMLTQTY